MLSFSQERLCILLIAKHSQKLSAKYFASKKSTDVFKTAVLIQKKNQIDSLHIQVSCGTEKSK